MLAYSENLHTPWIGTKEQPGSHQNNTMKTGVLLECLGLFYLLRLTQGRRDYDKNDYYVLHLAENFDPATLTRQLNLHHHGSMVGLDNHHIFQTQRSGSDIVHEEMKRRRRKRNDDGDSWLNSVLYWEKQKPQRRLESRLALPPMLTPYGPQASFGSMGPRPRTPRDQILEELKQSDPTFQNQWHLYDPEFGGDINVVDLWAEGITGKNVTIAIVDDGIESTHPDLKDNFLPEASWDFNAGLADPNPKRSTDKHGTKCAGLVAATRNNNICGVGVAYDAKISGIRVLGGHPSYLEEAEAMTFKSQINDIYSCSWGPTDNGKRMQKPGLIVQRAIVQAIQQGRRGLGSIYVFASGNGGDKDDNCNFDGYTNSIFSITVGAVDRYGNHPKYSEQCSANLVVSYSSGGGSKIHTTSVGGGCYNRYGGTSAAAPMAAGVFALVLQVRPDLSWRDLQYLALSSASQDGLKEADWQKTASGRLFSHKFGYGKIDAKALVQQAKEWKSVKPQAYFFSPVLTVNKSIPENEPIISSFYITKEMLENANIERLEHVTVKINVEHGRRGDLSVDLLSPDDVISHIATARQHDDDPGGYTDWTFMSVAHWGESGVGEWTIKVHDVKPNVFKGKFMDWRLELWGEAIDAGKAKPLPLPTE